MTKAKLDLIAYHSMLDMIERSKRGGLCYVSSKRYVKANNHYLPDYDDSQEENYIIYEDANSLYAWAMMQALPYKDLKFDTTSSLRAILDTPDDGPVGYIIEVDFEFPVELHDKFKEYPPAPQTIAPDIEWFSDFQHEQAEKHGIVKNGVYQGAPKLIPHLYKHTNYVIHYRNLKYLGELGVRITKLHKTISFQQTAWMLPYIQFNNDKRKDATNNFQKDLFNYSITVYSARRVRTSSTG